MVYDLVFGSCLLFNSLIIIKKICKFSSCAGSLYRSGGQVLIELSKYQIASKHEKMLDSVIFQTQLLSFSPKVYFVLGEIENIIPSGNW